MPDLIATAIAQIVDAFAIGGDGAVEDAGGFVRQLAQAVGEGVPGIKLVDAVFVGRDQATLRITCGAARPGD